MATSKTLESETERLRNEVLERVAQILDGRTSEAESPAETAMFWALLGSMDSIAIEETPLFAPPKWPGMTARGYAEEARGWISGGALDVFVLPQLEIKAGERSYRLDFGVCVTDGVFREHPPVFIDVEVDGHDYHERTKAQAERDKQRDRDLQGLGWAVARFTGAEVYRSAEEAAEKVWELYYGVVRSRSTQR